MCTHILQINLSRNNKLIVLPVSLSLPVAVPEPEAAEGRVVVCLLTGPRPGARGHPVVPDGGAQPVILEHHEQEQAAEQDGQADQDDLGGVGGALGVIAVWLW